MEITIKIHSNLTSKINKVNKKMNNFNINNILTIYIINGKSLINIGYKNANRKENLCFLIRISRIFNT